jgi:hypothetical protein
VASSWKVVWVLHETRGPANIENSLANARAYHATIIEMPIGQHLVYLQGTISPCEQAKVRLTAPVVKMQRAGLPRQ